MTTPNPPVTIEPLISGYMVSRVIHVATELGIADLVAEGKQTTEELARATETDPRSLGRLLRVLATCGVIQETAPDRFELGPAGPELMKGTPNSLRNRILMWGNETSWRSWQDLLHSVRSGGSAFEHVYGMTGFEYRATRPDEAAAFNETMAEFTRAAAKSLLAVHDFSRYGSVVDVGGGTGTFIAAILESAPKLRGVLFDLASGVAGADRVLTDAGVADRCTVQPGSFFEEVPKGGDVYVLKQIIQDWDDARATAILRACRRSMAPDARLLVIENVRPIRTKPENRGIAVVDLLMLVGPGGGFRTEDEHRALLRSGGFECIGIVSAGFQSVIEAKPI